MINGFEKQTHDLTNYERNTLLPIMCKCFSHHIGKENAVTNSVICEKMNNKGYEKVTEARVRKIINHIRTNNLVPRLMASGNGYYITNSPSELRDYISSLKGRKEAIEGVICAVQKQYDDLVA
jgi:hypothetical protein